MSSNASPRGSTTNTPVYAVVIPVCFAIFWLWLGARSIDIGRRHDFLNLYTGASLALEGRFADLYDPDTQLQRERQTRSRHQGTRTVRAPAILRVADFAAGAAAIWRRILGLAGLPGLAGRGLHRVGLPEIRPGCGLFCIHVRSDGNVHSPRAGRACPVGVVVASYALAEKGRPVAGAVLSLGLIKFHLFVLWPVLLAVQKKWRMLGYFMAGSTILAGGIAPAVWDSGRTSVS